MSDIIIYGRGKTGQSLYNLLARQGKRAVFYDDKTGFDSVDAFTADSVVLLSPGVRPNSAGVNEAVAVGSKLIPELEYCFPLCKGRCISVTGTNGKTTTCEMIYHLLRQAKLPCRLLGNGGVPFSSEVLQVQPSELVVLESSSFQLMNVVGFAPFISVFTNVACDHIDYHGSYENYILAKLNNFIHQTNGYAIFNADDESVVELSEYCSCEKLYYSVNKTTANCYLDGDNVVINVKGFRSKTPAKPLQMYVKHNLSNALAAILTAYLSGVSPYDAVSSMSSYRLLPHRMEVVATVDGVTFVDDSKATNVHATVSALDNYYGQNLALILGGSDKGEEYDGIFRNLDDNVVAVTASGDTANAIARCGAKYNVAVKVFDDIKQATEYCYGAIRRLTQGVVLMSNACASFDKFSGYAERGDYFRKIAEVLSSGTETN